MKVVSIQKEIHIVGAGISGLTAAILLAKSGRKIILHEARNEVGARFGGDLQGLENWSSQQDLLLWMKFHGLTTDFNKFPAHTGEAYDAWDNKYTINSEKPLFYLVERGPGRGSLDSALLQQAVDLGVNVEFNSHIKSYTESAILATGPKAADAIAVGYHFNTNRDNGFWVILNDEIAPKGYAYLLVMDGKATLKICLFRDFQKEEFYLERAMDAFKCLTGIEINNPIFHGGAGNFLIPKNGKSGIHLVIGEQAGFQDFLWGFGMRYAMESAVLAVQSLVNDDDYDKLWKSHLLPKLRNAIVNRVIYTKLGNTGYRWFLRKQQQRGWNVWNMLHRLYQPTFVKRALYSWANKSFVSQRKDFACHFDDCNCIWCRHGKPGLRTKHRSHNTNGATIMDTR